MLVPAVPAVLYYFTDYVPEGIFPGRVNLGLTFSASRNLFSVVWNMAVFALIPVSTLLFDVAPETRSLTVWLVPNHNVFNCIAFPFADPLGKGLRASGDSVLYPFQGRKVEKVSADLRIFFTFNIDTVSE